MSSHVRSLLWQGYRQTMPLMLGVAPFGLVFGALAISNGMDVFEAVGMSILVLAGSSQFVASQLIGDSAPVIVIVFTTFVINLRHFLYSASLASFFRPLSAGWKYLLGYMMVDEVYAMVMARRVKRDLAPEELRWFFVGSGFCLISLWWASTLVGALLGDILPDSTRDALGFTLPLIFTSLVVPALRRRPALVAALSAAVAGILLAPLPNRLGLVAAALIGIGAGVWSESRLKQAMGQEPTL
jgi:4-azaleucine resistance transporter AzlC